MAQKEGKIEPRMSKLRQALLKLKLPASFPSDMVANAYMTPDVDRSNHEFTWTLPELSLLRKYGKNCVCKIKFYLIYVLFN